MIKNFSLLICIIIFNTGCTTHEPTSILNSQNRSFSNQTELLNMYLISNSERLIIQMPKNNFFLNFKDNFDVYNESIKLVIEALSGSSKGSTNNYSSAIRVKKIYEEFKIAIIKKQPTVLRTELINAINNHPQIDFKLLERNQNNSLLFMQKTICEINELYFLILKYYWSQINTHD